MTNSPNKAFDTGVNALGYKMRYRTCSKIWDRLWNRIHDKIDSRVWDRVWDRIWDRTESMLFNRLGAVK